MAKTAEAQRRYRAARSSASGTGSVPKSAGTIGTGIAITNANGKVTNYYVATDGLREIRTAKQAPKSRTMTTKEQVTKMLENSNAQFLSKADVSKLRKQYLEDRANTPDYETGNPFGERGRGKRVYRPRSR